MKKAVIGDCTLYCGDSLSLIREGIIPVVDHAIFDPPYEEEIHNANKKLSGRKLRKDGGNEFTDFGFDSIAGIREDVVVLLAPLVQKWFISFCTIEGTHLWAQAINASPMKYKRPCVWVKPDATPQLNGLGPAIGAECFVCAWGGKGYSEWNAGGKRGVYTHNVNPPSRINKNDGGHPTEKPVSLMKEIILDFTKEGQVIFDPFMGSGTTGVACVQLRRKFIGIELQEKYFDLSCRRIEEAQRLADNQADLFISSPKYKNQRFKFEGAEK